jgi:hypothetical protein
MQLPLQNTYVLSTFNSSLLLPFYSFHALDTYIQSQKALLARTQSDLDRLRRIRDQATTHPDTFFHSADEKVFFVFNDQLSLFNQRSHSSVILFSLLIVSPTSLPRSKIKSTGIYSDVKVCPVTPLFLLLTNNSDVKDPTPLHALAADLRATHHARSQPSMKQQSALSSAQQLVRTARRNIIEPVLASFELSSDSSDEEQEPAPLEIRRIHLRKSGLTVRASGVHILRDVQDESQDVDIATDGEPLAPAPSTMITSLPPPHSPTEPMTISAPSMRSSRPRRPLPTRPHAAKAKQSALKAEQLSGPPIAKKEKPRSETYKQAWSVSEQHLLERLLAEIPDGEKNRYATSCLRDEPPLMDTTFKKVVQDIKGNGWSPHSTSSCHSRAKVF